MSQLRLIRSDDYGIYVLTGGYAFRPVSVARQHFFPQDKAYGRASTHLASEASKLVAGDKVRARHRAGSTLATVGNETWVSSSVDPRYIEYAP